MPSFINYERCLKKFSQYLGCSFDYVGMWNWNLPLEPNAFQDILVREILYHPHSPIQSPDISVCITDGAAGILP